MEQRSAARLGTSASVVGLGTWQLGADWGDVAEDDARAVLEASAQAGVTFYDTADVYGDGRSERLVGAFAKDHPGVFVATKMGRRAAQEPESYTPENFRSWITRSLQNLGTEQLDLVQLHCPPSAVIESDATWDALVDLEAEGLVAAYGVSVETCDQALTAIRSEGVASVQIILNAFRLKPLDEVLTVAREHDVAVIARVPLASGLLTGRFDEDTTFAENDHRTYNREGQAFDVGETFSGVPYDVGLRASREFSALVRETFGQDVTPAQAALAWIAAQPGLTTVIPGASRPSQARDNAAAADVEVPRSFQDGVRDVYDRHLRALVHHRW